VPGGEPLSEPLWHSKPVGAVAWGSDGRALFSSSGSEVRVWDTATGLTAGDRRFLAKFARAFSSATVDISGRLSPHVVEPLAQLQAIGKNLGKGSASSLSEWFFADPTRRALTPFSLTNVPNYIEARISEGTPASLDEASLLAEGDAVLHERIENRRRKKPAAQ
jgi:WD40 repeat protein